MRSASHGAVLAALAVLVEMAGAGPATPAGAQIPPDTSAYILTALGGRAALLQWRGFGGPPPSINQIARQSASGRTMLPALPVGATSAVDVLPDDVQRSLLQPVYPL